MARKKGRRFGWFHRIAQAFKSKWDQAEEIAQLRHELTLRKLDIECRDGLIETLQNFVGSLEANTNAAAAEALARIETLRAASREAGR